MAKIVQANCETGEVIERDMTDSELTAHNEILDSMVIAEEQKNSQENLRQSALAKLAQLGLSESEINSILS